MGRQSESDFCGCFLERKSMTDSPAELRGRRGKSSWAVSRTDRRLED
jgi:hypothetical protein